MSGELSERWKSLEAKKLKIEAELRELSAPRPLHHVGSRGDGPRGSGRDAADGERGQPPTWGRDGPQGRAPEVGEKRRLASGVSLPSDRVASEEQEEGDQDEDTAGKRQRVAVDEPVRALPPRKPESQTAYEDAAVKKRDRRMFGALMGHLGSAQRAVKRDAAKLKNKSQVETLVQQKNRESGARLRRMERELAQSHKEETIQKRDLVIAEMRKTEIAMESAEWATKHRKLNQFIVTSSQPPIYWLPTAMTDATEQMQAATRAKIEADVAAREEQDRREFERIDEDVHDRASRRQAKMAMRLGVDPSVAPAARGRVRDDDGAERDRRRSEHRRRSQAEEEEEDGEEVVLQPTRVDEDEAYDPELNLELELGSKDPAAPASPASGEGSTSKKRSRQNRRDADAAEAE